MLSKSNRGAVAEKKDAPVPMDADKESSLLIYEQLLISSLRKPESN